MRLRSVIPNVMRKLLKSGKSIALLGMAMVVVCLPAFAAETRYAKMSIQSLSDALFKIGVLRASDPLAVDEYIRIHHCGLYEQYGANDLAWTRLREAQARELQLMSSIFNENLEIEGALLLGNYDFSTARFALTPETAMKNMGLIKALDHERGSYEPCGEDNDFKPFVPRAHPLRLTVRISEPLTLTELPVSREVADALLKQITLRRDDKNRRAVTLVMRIRLGGPDPLSGSSEISSMTVTGDLYEILVYSAPDRKTLLYANKFIDPSAPKK